MYETIAVILVAWGLLTEESAFPCIIAALLCLILGMLIVEKL